MKSVVTMIIVSYGKINAGKLTAQNFHFILPAVPNHRNSHCAGRILDHTVCLVRSRVVDHGGTSGDDPGLFPCHLLYGMAQVLLMIQSDLGNDI